MRDAAGTKLDSANRTGGESVETHSRAAQSVAEAIFFAAASPTAFGGKSSLAVLHQVL